MGDLPHAKGSTMTRDYWPTAGWRTADPTDHALDAARLDAAFDYLRATVPHMNSLLIARGGYLVYERYRDTRAADTPRNVMSVTKSVLSALIGIAIQTGDLASADEPIGHILPETFVTVEDKRKRAITIRDLLTMRSGLEWEEYGPDVMRMTTSPDWMRHVLALPLVREPGTRFNYSTGDTQVLAAALQKLTAMTALDYADLYLFGPLGITARAWPADPQGINIGGAELRLTPRDMLKFGYLHLNQGRWDGNQLIPADWIAACATYHTLFEPSSPEDCEVLGYGQLWWLRPQGDHESLIAVGFGGQFVYVIPGLDIVVVMTGDLDGMPAHFRDNRMLCRFNLVEDFIVPAAG
jgi:CubicO group peptidase (beta-lactamase class C family)